MNGPQPSALEKFNAQTGNRIFSDKASLDSRYGTAIEIQLNTFIDPFCEIGSYTYIGQNVFITKAEIGRYCSIANNVSIGPGEHKLDRISTSSHFYDDAFDILTENDCIIGNDVWIGVDSIVKRNVTIGDGAVIGANSFVNKDVPPFAIVAGNPAKIIKYRFNDEQQQAITKSGWWLLELDEAEKAQQSLSKIIG